MPSLKDLKIRIESVKSTRKITKAMQMVAAAKLRRAQESAENARPYAERMNAVLGNLAAGVSGSPTAPRLVAGTGKSDVHLLMVATSERGLCGGFNSSIVRLARARILVLQAEGKTGFEYKIYEDVPGGHTFNRLDTQVAKESRREIWRFLAPILRPARPIR
jgi:F-type H+-transporting ATPase subunit gamma